MKKVLLILLLIVSTFGLTGCVSSSIYSDAAHLRRIARRVEKRYMGKDSEYTSFELYKIYNENDEFKYVLVEFEPYGFVYVQINPCSFIYGGSMYTRYDSSCWFKQWIIDNPNNDCIKQYEIISGKIEEYNSYRNTVYCYEYNEYGELIVYNQSHYKVAGVLEEKLYMIGDSGGVIPALKKGDMYLNLISPQDKLLSFDEIKKESEDSFIIFPGVNVYDL